MQIQKKHLWTVLFKALALGGSFALVILTARLWGASGRGIISLFLSDISIILILSNIVCGATISYHLIKYDIKKIIGFSIITGILICAFGALLFSILHGTDQFLMLFLVSSAATLSNLISSVYIAFKNIIKYNITTAFIPILTLLFLLGLLFVSKQLHLQEYYIALLCTYVTIVLFFGTSLIKGKNLHHLLHFDFKVAMKIVRYGFNHELSMILQFLNYRFSYYVIGEYIGNSELGVFSVAMSLVEALWIFSKSLSINQYSDVLNEVNQKKNITSTQSYSWSSLLLTLSAFVFTAFIPNSVFTTIFGQEFNNVKIFLFYLAPGVLFISYSNIIGHYFSAMGNVSILKKKSFIGLIATVSLSFLLIPTMGLSGACITVNTSYIVSSIYLLYYFEKTKKILG